MGEKGKVHLHPKANTNGFKQNPQNINRSGKNKSLFAAIKKEIFSGEDIYMNFMEAEIIDEDRKPTGEFTNVRTKVAKKDFLMMHYLKRASLSDKVLLDMIDRIDGKPGYNNLPGGNAETIEVEDIQAYEFSPLEAKIYAEYSRRLLLMDDSGQPVVKEEIDFEGIIKEHKEELSKEKKKKK